MTASGGASAAGRGAGVLKWLGPWRVGGPTAHRLGVVLAVTLVWDVVVAFDGHIPPGFLALAVTGTVAVYPLLAAACAVTLRHPISGWWARWPAARLLSVCRMLFVVMAVLLGLQVPSLLAATAAVRDDVAATTICAARDVLQGHDPYQTPELACLHRLHLPVTLATPVQRGPFAHLRSSPTPLQLERVQQAVQRSGYQTPAFWSFGYPPLAFAWMLPVALGGHALWVAWTLLAALVWLGVALRGSRSWWPALACIILLQWGGGSVLAAASQGDSEFFAFALTALALLFIDRPRRSAVCLGLAMATNPLPWVIVPGYVLFTRTLPRAWPRLAWLAGAVLTAVVPWLLVYRDAAGAMLTFLREPTFSEGVGVGSLALLHLGLPSSRSAMFLLFGLAVLALVAWGAVRRPYAAAVPAVAVAAFWLSWRSDANYLTQLPLWAGAMAIGLERLHRRPPVTEPSATAALAAAPRPVVAP